MGKTKVSLHRIDCGLSAVPGWTKETCPILHTFRPVMRMLQLCGVVYDSRVSGHRSPCSCVSNDRPRRKVSERISRIFYMMVLYVVTLSSVVRLASCVVVHGISTESGESLMLLTMACVCVASVINATYLIVRLRVAFPNFLARLCCMHHKYDISTELEKLRKWSFRGMVLVGVVIVGMELSLIIYFATNSLHGLSSLFSCPFEGGQVVPLDIISSGLFLASAAVSMPLLIASFAAYAGFCYLSGTLFIKLAKQLEGIGTSPQEQHDLQKDCMDDMIELHQGVCEVLEKGNASFNHHIPTVYVYTLPSICFVSNALMQLSSVSDYLTLSISVEIFMVSILTATVWIGAVVNSKAVEARDSLFRMRTKESSSNRLQLACFFATTLNSSEVGVKVFDIFVIGKSHLLTLFGLLITYTVLIVQFNSSNVQPGN